jgi:hypothetical protein
MALEYSTFLTGVFLVEPLLPLHGSSWVGNGGGSFKIWRVACNILNESRESDMVCSSNLSFEWEIIAYHNKHMLRNVTQGLACSCEHGNETSDGRNILTR